MYVSMISRYRNSQGPIYLKYPK